MLQLPEIKYSSNIFFFKYKYIYYLSFTGKSLIFLEFHLAHGVRWGSKNLAFPLWSEKPASSISKFYQYTCVSVQIHSHPLTPPPPQLIFRSSNNLPIPSRTHFFFFRTQILMTVFSLLAMRYIIKCEAFSIAPQNPSNNFKNISTEFFLLDLL